MAEIPETPASLPGIDMETEMLACKDKIKQLEDTLISLASQMLQMQSSVEETTTRQQALETTAKAIESDMLKIPVNKPARVTMPIKSYDYQGTPSRFFTI